MISLSTSVRALGGAILVAAQVYGAAAAADGAAAQRIYERHCVACHGEKGDGKSRAQFGLTPPPRDFTTEQAWRELSRERMITSVTHGRPGTAMVGWANRLSESEIAAVVDYIRATFMHPPGDDGIASGQQIYKRHCAACHGDNGSGATWTRNSLNPAPRDFTAPAARAELSRPRMLTSVTYGRPGTAMMPFGSRLSESEIAAVVDYIRERFMSAGQAVTPPVPPPPRPQSPEATGTPPASVDMTRPFPGGLRGDPEAGERFYMGNCYVCHGRRGDGKGPRAAFIEPPPRNFLTAESRRRLNRPALFEAIANGRRGTVMPAWSTVLDEQQIADVAEFVFRSFIQGDARKGGRGDGRQPSVAAPPAKKKAPSE